MKRCMKLLTGVATILAMISFAGPATADAFSKEWKFRVYLDDRKIGYHSFTVRDEGGQRRVESKARFEVRLLLFKAYGYEHENLEIWRDGCLARIEASTDDNGQRSSVRGALGGNGFSLDRGPYTSTLPECVSTFAYWDPEFLDSTRLLNPQTGEYLNVNILDQGETTRNIGGVDTVARQYQLLFAEQAVNLWYDRNTEEWLALETEVEGGRRLRYEPVPDEGERIALGREEGSADES